MINKYTWARGDERSMIDYVLVQENRRKDLMDVTVRRGVAAGITDHYLVEAKVRVTGHWKSEGGMMRMQVVDVKKYERREVRDEYKEMIAREWTRVKDSEIGSPE